MITQNVVMKIKTQHTLKSIENDMAEIETISTIAPVNAGDKIKGTQTGISKVNLKNGWSSEKNHSGTKNGSYSNGAIHPDENQSEIITSK